MRNSLIFNITTGIAALITLAATIIMIINWSQIPDQIPTHFGLNGEADAYGGKGTLIFFDILAWTLLIGMSIMSKYPNTWNFPVKVTEHNKARLYVLGRAMLEITKLFIAIMFSLIIIGLSLSSTIPQALVMVMVAAILIISTVFIILMRKCK